MKMLQIRGCRSLACLLIGSSTLPAEDQNSRQIYDKSSSTCNWFVINQKFIYCPPASISSRTSKADTTAHLSRWFELYKSLNIPKYFTIQMNSVLLRTNGNTKLYFSMSRLCPLPNAEYGCLWGWILVYVCLILLHSYSAAIPLAAGLN